MCGCLFLKQPSRKLTLHYFFYFLNQEIQRTKPGKMWQLNIYLIMSLYTHKGIKLTCIHTQIRSTNTAVHYHQQTTMLYSTTKRILLINIISYVFPFLYYGEYFHYNFVILVYLCNNSKFIFSKIFKNFLEDEIKMKNVFLYF